MQELKTIIKEYFLVEREDKRHKKVSFYPTESEMSAFEIYHRFKGTPETNPMDVKTRFALGMRKKLEEAVVSILDNIGILKEKEPYTDLEGKLIEKPEQHRVDIEREGIRITGYMDEIILEDEKQVPLEIKTSYGMFAQKELLEGKPKTNYLKQLAIYMDSINAEKGYLLQVHFEKDLIIDDIYQFTLVKIGERKYRCNKIVIDLNEVYTKYKYIWDNNIKPDVEPKSKFRYKYPLEEINWKELSKNKISNARNNKAVIGDWQVIYSSYKDLIVKKESESLGKTFEEYIGYSDDELRQIKEQTRGYTTWN